MAISCEEVKEWITIWENNTHDFKSCGILSHPEDIAELMVAFGNNKFVSEDFGGRIIIGVEDATHEIENFEVKTGHEEHIMNIARDKCYPSIHPTFEIVSCEEKHVYVITIPKMTETPYQIITKEGKSHRIRVGTTIREPTSEELSMLYNQKSDTHDDKINTITTKFPSRTNQPLRQITIIPIDSNSKMITLNPDNSKLVMDNAPTTSSITDKKIIQNEIHFQNRNFPSRNTCWGIINDLGFFSMIEILIQSDKIMYIEREIVFLLDALKFIKKIYEEFGYNQRILIQYNHQNVQNFDFKTWDISDKFHFIDKKVEISDFVIERTVAISSLDSKALVGSIIEEIARACNWTVNEGEFEELIKLSIKKVPDLE